jgi:hypothetical protein
MRKSLGNTFEKSENVSKITQIPKADPDGQRFCLQIQSLSSTLTWGLAEGPVNLDGHLMGTVIANAALSAIECSRKTLDNDPMNLYFFGGGSGGKTDCCGLSPGSSHTASSRINSTCDGWRVPSAVWHIRRP